MSSNYLKNKSLCPLPFAGAVVNTNGDVLCCSISKEVLGNVKNTTLEEILTTSKKLKEIRRDMLDNKFPHNCSDCYDKEKHHTNLNFENISNRLYHVKILKDSPFKLYKDEHQFELQQMDLRWRNTCNFACVYCDSHFSSVWAQFEGQPDKMTNSAMNETFEFVKKNIKNLKTIYMAGGEPFLIKENIKVIDLVQKENPDLLLRINTNLSILTPKLYDQLKTLKNVHWIVSAEATDQKFNYIRWPGKYSTLVANIKKIQELPHKVTINMTWNLLCAFNILEFIDDMMENGVHPNQFVMNFVSDPIEQSVSNITKQQRDVLIVELKKRIDNTNNTFFLYKVYEEMIDILNRPLLDTYRTALYNTLMDLDKKRKLNSKEIFPELYNKD
jgi:radical SAM protein with 4Fe4S-binding SPASM domain|tara:strand:- start:566 stop:1723 length:1158 start_codon:yes stop_codon:yes gene_type:complete